MKKSIIALAFATLGIAGASYAATPVSGSPASHVPVNVETEFTQQFTDAVDVRWEEGKDFFKATFEDWGRTLFAFYSDNGDLMGVATNLSSSTLPARLQAGIKNSYGNYWITDLFGYHNANGKGYVITLENADRIVILKADGDGNWAIYKTKEKS